MQRELEDRVDFLSKRPLFFGWKPSVMTAMAKVLLLAMLFMRFATYVLWGSHLTLRCSA